MSAIEEYRQAAVRAEQKKAQLLASAEAAKNRITPARLVEDVKHKAVDSLASGREYVSAATRERPVATGAAAAALLIYMFRRPLSALFKRTYVRITNRNPTKAEIDDG